VKNSIKAKKGVSKEKHPVFAFIYWVCKN